MARQKGEPKVHDHLYHSSNVELPPVALVPKSRLAEHPVVAGAWSIRRAGAE